MKKLLCVALLALSGFANAGEDRFGDAHWKIHFAGAVALGTITSHYTDNQWVAFGAAMAPLVARELWKRERGFSNFTTSRNVAHIGGVLIGMQFNNCVLSPESVYCVFDF